MMIEGIDIYTADLTREWLRDHPQYQVVVQNLWPGGWANRNLLRMRVPQNLENALLEGRTIAGYIVVTPDQPTQWYDHDFYEEAMAEAKIRAGDFWDKLHSLWVDIETLSDNDTTYWPTEGLALSWAERMSAEKPVGVYSAAWFLNAYYQNPSQEWLRYPLWAANYSVAPSLGQQVQPWPSLTGHQYRGTANLDGITADENIFDEGWFMADGLTEERVRKLANEEDAGENTRIDWLALDLKPRLERAEQILADLKHIGEAAAYLYTANWVGLRAYMDSENLG